MYFTRKGIDMCICRLYKAVLRYNNGSMLNHIKNKHPAIVTEALGGKSKTTVGSLKYSKREAAIKEEKTLSKKSTHEDEEDEPCPKRGMSKQEPNTSEIALTEGGAPEQFGFQYGLEGPTFKNENGESSKSHLSIIKVEQLDSLLPDQTDSSCGSGSPGDSGPPGSSGSGSNSSPASQFFRKCHQAGCTQFIFSEFASRLSTITERIASQQASEEDFNLTLKVLEASGMLPEIFTKRDQEMEKRLRELQRETVAVRTARSAMRDACVMSFTSS
ncbi:uncharacterized protein LOC129820745 isoform X4 [Salvelinus fontinalis]|uniref:uncharacterized protein LOC129820745 isoform X4 n=1 Tax=Salvelinus fontinalis TaxID=8038 RepID=UPI002485318F|nr:uncharacterized protein LOC129820745 isoform X4 [Salvelinus fontinalis]